MKPHRRALCWVRRDLRLRDHAALALATSRAEQVAVVFVFDRNILDALDRDDRRVGFIHRSLEEMDAKLRRVGSQLVVLHGDPRQEIPRLVRELQAEAVFAARDVEPYAKARDRAVADQIPFEVAKDTVVFEAGELGTHRLHSTYFRAWQSRFDAERHAAFHHADKAALWPAGELPETPWSLESLGFDPAECPVKPGEDAARERLRDFETRLETYRQDRNAPAMEATSGLSVHLRFGTVSVRECVRTALRHPGEGARKWLSEISWRDFYMDVLAQFPQVADGPFLDRLRNLEFPGNPEHEAKWQDGQTGFPLVDAAMRCLMKTGTMHNRLRMVAASFLANDLLLDYRHGEAWFARHLLDFDLASNNGNWQYCAGTSDGVPNHSHIVNPTLQSRKFDPDGLFIRRWVPELRGLFGPAIHEPSKAPPLELQAAGVVLGETYPWPLVDHAEMRRRAVARLAP